MAGVLENVSSMMGIYRQTISRALNVPDDYVMTINSADWTACPRDGQWFATFPALTEHRDTLYFPRRTYPWGAG